MTDKGSDDFAAMLAEFGGVERVRLQVGQAVHAKVIHLAGDHVFCEISRSQEAVLAAEEVRNAEGELTVQVGDELDLYVLALGDTIVLGKRLGKGGFDVAALEAARAAGLPIEGTVSAVNKGGLEVTVAGTRGFCPIGQADIEYVEDPATFIGKTLQFLVTEVREGGRNVVLNRRNLLQRERDANAKKALKEIAVGQKRTGTVQRVADFGAFVDIGGLEGLVPISEMSHSRVASTAEVVKVGDLVEVEVLRIEDDPKRPGKTRIALSMRAAAPDPFFAFAERAPIGQRIEGEVMRLEAFGAFVRLAPGLEGLVHISEMSDRRIGHPREVVEVGQTVGVRVLQIDRERRRIGLSLKDERQDAPAGAGLRVGQDVSGVVDRHERYGVFVKLTSGEEALLPAAETGTERGTDLARALPKGTEVHAKVIGIDDRGRVKISKKALDDAEERATVAQFGTDNAAGKGLGTLGDLLAKKTPAKRKR